METIHLKTVDPISQQLLRSAAQRGIELPWERYEKLQPQDGFLRLGLSCPYGCMQGPCRIDPFGRGPEKGVCGLGRDEMVAGMMLRLCLQGAMDAFASVQPYDSASGLRYSQTLNRLVEETLSKHGQPDLSVDDILKSNLMLNRSSCPPEEVLLQALRLGLLSLGFLEQAAEEMASDSLPCRSGYGTISDMPIRIGFSGKVSAEIVTALEEEAKKDSKAPVALVSLGEWILMEDRFMPIASTSGESELLVSSGAIHLLVAGTGTDPGLEHLCRQLNVPVVTDTENTEAGDIISRARQRFEALPLLDLFSDVSPALEGHVLMSAKKAAQVLGKKPGEKVVIIGGSDTPQMSLGHLPIELATKLADKDLQLAGWGDAALWLQKSQTFSKDQAIPIPFSILENRQGPLLAVKGLADAGKLDCLQGICFTGIKSCLELTMAMGLAFLGCRISVATPIPILGSRTVCDSLSALLSRNGGQLLHFDHPAQVGELFEWFTNR